MMEWWTNQQAGLVFGIGGGAIGILGAVFGTTMGVFAPRGKLRALNTALAALMVGVGVASLGTMAVALAMRQPFHVWFGFGNLGLILTFLGAMMFPLIRRVYMAAENRRLDAADLRRTA